MREFEVINYLANYPLKNSFGKNSDLSLGIGDDGAVLKFPNTNSSKLAGQSNDLVVVTDSFIVGVHCPVNTSAYDIGWKSLAVNLSDMAAMGAEPRWATLNLSFSDYSQAWIKQFFDGFYKLAKLNNVALIGGDTCRIDSKFGESDKNSNKIGAKVISVTVFGPKFLASKSMHSSNSFYRSNAQVGDDIWLSGILGLAGYALEKLFDKKTLRINQNASGNFDKKLLEKAIEKLNKPMPQNALSRKIAPYVNACIDISDGFLADLDHICKSSKVNCDVELDKIVSVNNTDTEKKLVDLSIGDDYELIFTSPTKFASKIGEIDENLHRVGKITKAKKRFCINLQQNGKQLILGENLGYIH